jgi:hypothetical protein
MKPVLQTVLSHWNATANHNSIITSPHLVMLTGLPGCVAGQHVPAVLCYLCYSFRFTQMSRSCCHMVPDVRLQSHRQRLVLQGPKRCPASRRGMRTSNGVHPEVKCMVPWGTNEPANERANERTNECRAWPSFSSDYQASITAYTALNVNTSELACEAW